MVELAVECMTATMAYAIPISVVFELGNVIVGTFMRVAFGGRLWFGK